MKNFILYAKMILKYGLQISTLLLLMLIMLELSGIEIPLLKDDIYKYVLFLSVACNLIFGVFDRHSELYPRYEYREYLLEELKQNESEQAVDSEKMDCENIQQHNSSGETLEQVEKSNGDALNHVLVDNNDIVESYEKRKADKRDIIALMLKNNDEITEYFTISKSQAKSSYRFSIITCIVGILMLAIAIYGAIVINNLQLTIIGTASGAITEVISGTVLWIHNKSALQLNHYYDALHENEKFLSAINIADKLSEEKKEEIYIEIIRKQIDAQTKQTLPDKKTDIKEQ